MVLNNNVCLRDALNRIPQTTPSTMRLTNRGFLYTPPPAEDGRASGENRRTDERDELTPDDASTTEDVDEELSVADITPTTARARWTGDDFVREGRF